MTKKRLELSPELRAWLRNALAGMLREADAIQAEMNDLTPDEWRSLKADALKTRRRPKPRGRGPSQYTDAHLLALEQKALREFHSKRRVQSGRRRWTYEWIAHAIGLSSFTIRDRLLAAHRKAAKNSL